MKNDFQLTSDHKEHLLKKILDAVDHEIFSEFLRCVNEASDEIDDQN